MIREKNSKRWADRRKFRTCRKDEELTTWFIDAVGFLSDLIKHEQLEHAFSLKWNIFIDLRGLDIRSQVTKLLKVIKGMLSRMSIKAAQEVLIEYLSKIGGIFEEDINMI